MSEPDRENNTKKEEKKHIGFTTLLVRDELNVNLAESGSQTWKNFLTEKTGRLT